MVPGLTFGNAVLCLKTDALARLEINQRTVGRLALGAHSKTTNEAVQGIWAGRHSKFGKLKAKFVLRIG